MLPPMASTKRASPRTRSCSLHRSREPDDARPELPDTHWVQYVLDNFATVNEVVDAHRAGHFRVVAAWSNDLGYTKPLGIHLAVEDTSGVPRSSNTSRAAS